MIVDSHGRPIAPTPPELRDPVFDARVEDAGHVLPDRRDVTPEFRRDFNDEAARIQARMDALGIDDSLRGVNLDNFANEITGIGTTWGDKTLGGLPGGPLFNLYRMTGWESEVRARGSDLGQNIVNKIPDEMTRAGWDLEVQPSGDEAEVVADPEAQLDAALREPDRAAAGWRKVARSSRVDARTREAAHLRARRWDAIASGVLPTEAAPPPPPGPLPKINDSGIEIAEAMADWAKAIGLQKAVNQGLRYERLHGGGAVFIGADDGVDDLTIPLDPSSVKAITHLTPLTGGWDGEVVMWRPYNDPRKPKYGQPEIYQVRNTNVQLARPPAPGETRPVQQVIPQGPTGPTIFYVHESRFLIFDGQPVSRAAQQEMRGWGDSVFTRVNSVLSQYEQSWNAVAILLMEFSVSTLAVKGLARAIAEKGAAAQAQFLQYARFQALLTSVAKTRFIDSEETWSRTTASVAGVAEVLREWALRLAAAADQPASILFGTNSGGLGQADDAALRGWYDKINARQQNNLLPQLEYIYRLGWRAKNSPTKGVEPDRWSIVFRPLWRLTALEEAELRNKTVNSDGIEITNQVVTPEEVAAKRYGGPEYDPGPVVLDIESRTAASAARPSSPPAGASGQDTTAAAEAASRASADPIAAPGGPSSTATPATGSASVPVPPMTAMPSDPITGDPQSTPSVIGQTGAGGKPVTKPQTSE